MKRLGMPLPASPASKKERSAQPAREEDAGVIKVTEFVNARRQEIAVMLEEMKKSAKGRLGTRGVFQSLPRSLRRRSMSHNIHRVPMRLRAQAYHERKVTNSDADRMRKKKPSASPATAADDTDNTNTNTSNANALKTKRNRKWRRRPRLLLREYLRRSNANGKVCLIVSVTTHRHHRHHACIRM